MLCLSILKRLAKFLLWSITIATAFVVCCNLLILSYVSSDFERLPEKDNGNYKVALVLGTSKWTMRGEQNHFFKGRVEASSELYFEGIVRHLLLSGDNSLKAYNEPLLLKKELEALGVAPEAMTMDFAGFRTLDSVVRAKEVFGQDSLVIVTQPFHLPRALFIAHHHGVHAIGYEAPGPLPSRIWAREVLARTVAVIDIVLGTPPKFLGNREPLQVD